MLILAEPDARLRKRICDLLHRERIIVAATATEVVEKLVHFRSEIAIVVARIGLVIDLQHRELLRKICERLRIPEPPMLCYYTAEESPRVKDVKVESMAMKLLQLDEADAGFPKKFIGLLLELEPLLVYDLKRANAAWSGKAPAPEFVDPRQWLHEQGFHDVLDKMAQLGPAPDIDGLVNEINELLSGSTENIDYQRMYYELKDRYSKLLEYVKRLKPSP